MACFLVAFLRSDDYNKENVDKNMSVLLRVDVNTTYITHAVHCKYSVSDDVIAFVKKNVIK